MLAPPRLRCSPCLPDANHLRVTLPSGLARAPTGGALCLAQQFCSLPGGQEGRHSFSIPDVRYSPSPLACPRWHDGDHGSRRISGVSASFLLSW